MGVRDGLIAERATGIAALRQKAGIAHVLRALPEGALAIGVGLLVSGLSAYGYLVIASRALGKDAYSPLAGLWALTFVAAPGLFLPLEQEVGRALAARRVRGIGGRPVVVRAAVIGAGLVVATLVVSTIASPVLTDRLFDGQALLFVGFVVAVVLYSVYFLSRGTLAGNGRFRSYGWLLVAESGVRIAAAVALLAVGVKSAGVFSLAIGLPCLFAVLLIMPRQRGLALPGPPAPWSEISSALALLLIGSLLAQLLVNVGPLAVKAFFSGNDASAAGRFLDGLIVARVPAFFFQAVQASLLPKLSAQAAAGQLREFRVTLTRILVLVAGVTVAATLTMFLLGPFVVRVLFGEGFALGHGDLAILAFGSGLFMAALALAQANIALAGYARAALGWAVGLATVALVVAVIPGDILRVEIAFSVGVVAATLFLAGALVTLLRSRQGAVAVA